MKKIKFNFNILILVILIILIIIFLFFYFLNIHSHYIMKDRNGNNFKYNKELFIDNKKNKELKIIVIQDGAYNKFQEYSEYSTKINELYCKKWKYDYKFIKHDVKKMPPYWLKVNDLNEYINKNYDYVVFLDLDACFYDFDVSLENLITEVNNVGHTDFDIYIGKDSAFNSVANTGAFIFKNSNFGKMFAQIWLSTCINSQDKITNQGINWDYDTKYKVWNCDKCIWAGLSYEQGVFNYLYKVSNKNISVLDKSFLSNSNVAKKSFIFHGMGKTDKNRFNIFKQIYKKIKNI